MKRILSALVVALAVLNSDAQSPKPSAQLDAMSKLGWLVGNWKGAGWVEVVPGQRCTFTQTERVEWKAGRTVVAVEGHGTTAYAGTNLPIHDAFAVISFDPPSQQYRWRSHTEKGHAADLMPTVGDRRFEWAMDVPEMGAMRYTIVLNEKGEWFETGEMSRDHKTWRKFFEMTLQKAAPGL
jgi:hypothetical protein